MALVIAGGAPGVGHAVGVQSLLQDTNFDDQGGGVGDFCYLGNGCSSGAWSGGGAGFIRQNTASFAVGAVPSAPATAFVQGMGWIEQAFTASATGRYRIAWYAAGRPAGAAFDGNEAFDVRVGQQVVASGTTASGSGFRRYTSAAFDLVQGTAYMVRFQGKSNSDSTAYIDSVVLARENETVDYRYDALGRLERVEKTGVVTDGQTTVYTHDKADNRSNVKTTGVAP